ncbi:MAG: zinc ribbon domain-containing protein [Lachnospiraceae bacterium]|nr:zinc ribbon domain-containing protein [Lachnospiraceae bacterium]
MSSIQKSILEYVQDNKFLQPLGKCSGVLAVLYPVYQVLAHVSFLHFFLKYIGMIVAILYIAYLLGVIISFAQNKLIPLDIAFVCMAFNNMLGLEYGVNLNRLVYIAFYGLLAVLCIIATGRSSQWDDFKISTFDKAARYAVAAGDALSTKSDTGVICPECGNKCIGGAKFCNKCGKPLTDSGVDKDIVSGDDKGTVSGDDKDTVSGDDKDSAEGAAEAWADPK